MTSSDKLKAMKKQMEMEQEKRKSRPVYRARKKRILCESALSEQQQQQLSEPPPSVQATKITTSTPPLPPSPPPLLPTSALAERCTFYVCQTQYNVLNIDWIAVGLNPNINFAPCIRFYEASSNTYLSFDIESWTEFMKLEELITNSFLFSDSSAEISTFTTKYGTYRLHFEYVFGEKVLCVDYNNTSNKYFKFEAMKEVFNLKDILLYRVQFLENFNFQKYYSAIIEVITNLRESGNEDVDLQQYIQVLKDVYLSADMPKTLLGTCFLEVAHFLNSKLLADIVNKIIDKQLISIIM